MIKKEYKKKTFSEAGKLGAIALNSDKEKKREASRKAAQTRKAKDPDIFRKIGSIRKGKRDRETLDNS